MSYILVPFRIFKLEYLKSCRDRDKNAGEGNLSLLFTKHSTLPLSHRAREDEELVKVNRARLSLHPRAQVHLHTISHNSRSPGAIFTL